MPPAHPGVAAGTQPGSSYTISWVGMGAMYASFSAALARLQ